MEYMPSYMLWCVKNGDSDGNLVCDRTISALAEFGRAKDEMNHLNFKYLCNDRQKMVVYNFLNWCLSSLILISNKDQVLRSIKNWRIEVSSS